MINSVSHRNNKTKKTRILFIVAIILMSSLRARAFSTSTVRITTTGTDVTHHRRNSQTINMAVANVVEEQETRIGRYREVPKKSRSSTMPGFRNKETFNSIAYKQGIEVFESKTGKKIRRGTIKERRNGSKGSREMYAGSTTVPDSLVDFADQIHKEARISPTEERTLGTKSREAVQLQELYSNLEAKFGRAPTEDEWCAAAGKINMKSLREAIDDGIKAKNKLVTSNLRMVQGVVNLYIRNGLGSQYNAGDLMQEGIIALMHAAEKYEPDRGFRFSTYAMYWIRASVKRSQLLQSRTVYVPQRLQETYKRIQKTEQDLKAVKGRKPTTVELADECNLSEIQLERCVNAMKQKTFSLDRAISNCAKPQHAGQRESTLYDIIATKCDEGEHIPLEQRFMKDDLVNTLQRYLTSSELDMILLRYGLMDEKTLPHGFSGPLSIDEVSRLVGYKPFKVRRVINSSLKRLKPLLGNDWEHALA